MKNANVRTNNIRLKQKKAQLILDIFRKLMGRIIIVCKCRFNYSRENII